MGKIIVKDGEYAESKLGHISQRLSDVSVKYAQNEFVGSALFPEKPVNKGADLYTIYSKDNLFQVIDDTVGKTDKSRSVLTSSATEEFVVKNRALHAEVANEDIDNADDPLQPQIDATETVVASLLLRREMRQQALAASLAVNTTTPNVKWTVALGSPISDIEAACQATFTRPNTMVISRPVWDILSHFQGGNTGYKLATIEMIKALFGLDNVLIGGAKYNTTKKANAASLGYVWGKGVYLAYVDQATKDTPCFGRTFAQRLAGGATMQTRVIDQPMMGVGGGKIVQVEHRSIEKIISEDFGYYLSACIA